MWHLKLNERRWLLVGVCVALIFGAILEKRTALRRVPMTDLGVFCCASWAAWHGQDLYSVTDWNSWHYQYPPTLAILFAPLAHPPPVINPADGATSTCLKTNTPWGYHMRGQANYYGLDNQNLHFFLIVGVWYVISLFLVFGSSHLLACVLEGTKWGVNPPVEGVARQHWWGLRLLPLALCIGSFGTELSRGQVDVLMLAAISLALYLAAGKKDFRAGLAFSFPATVKLFPPLILLYPVLRLQWRMLIGIVVGLILALGILPAITLGPGRTAELYQTWTQVLAKPALGHGTDTSRAKELTGITVTDNQSLLAFIHDWRYKQIPHKDRPTEAAPWERYTVYAVTVLLLAGLGVVVRRGREDKPRTMVLITGVLIGVSFLASPIVHNFYYLVLLPLLAGLVDHALGGRSEGKKHNQLLIALGVFMGVDVLARLPGIGPVLRDVGAPMLSMVWLLGIATAFVWSDQRSHETSPPASLPTTSLAGA